MVTNSVGIWGTLLTTLTYGESNNRYVLGSSLLLTHVVVCVGVWGQSIPVTSDKFRVTGYGSQV